jgi:uroporphyrinogen decarboxylase
MTTHERMTLVYRHENPDRVPIFDSPWSSTLERWQREGLPANVSPHAFFGWDHIASYQADNSPRFPVETVEETEEYRIHTTTWGVTMRNWTHRGSVPEFLDYRVTRDTWPEVKERMTPDPDRVNWKLLEEHYPKWRDSGAWIQFGTWFGYDVMASWVVGYDRTLIAMADDPEFCIDFIVTCLDLDLALLELMWDRGFRPDAVRWPEDMGYRNGLLFSNDMYRRICKPAQKRLIDWAHNRGLKTQLHSCGNVMELIPEFVEIGLDGLNPLEQKAGMDALQIKREYGDKLVLEGGMDVRNWTDGAAAEREIAAKLPVLKENGGYIFHSDHSVPEDVSFADFCRVQALARWYGRY